MIASFSFLIGGVALVLRAIPPAPEASDGLLDALVAEASRSLAALRDEHDAPLYYLSYRVTDSTDFEIGASYGAVDTPFELDGGLNGRTRVLDVSVRVGSSLLDNTHRIRGGRPESDTGGAMGEALPIDDDVGALRLEIWRATDDAYKQAVKALARVRTNKAVKVLEEDPAYDFTVEPPHVSIGPRHVVAVNRQDWALRLRRLSAIFKEYPRILQSRVSCEGTVWTNYFVDTDGARIRTQQSYVRVVVQASAKADDGMDVSLLRDVGGATPDQLPSDSELERGVRELIEQLEGLRTAPIVEPYSGPAILTNRAAGVFFHEIFGHRIEGDRQKDPDEGRTFTHKVGQHVLPDFLNVVDNPTLDRFGPTWLAGHYVYDDEGVPAQVAPLVSKGTLTGFLMSRSPIHGFERSNGHGRAQPGMAAISRQGTLIVSSTEQVPFAELRSQLVKEINRQGKPYGLIFEDVMGGFTQTRTDKDIPQIFKVLPLVVKKVYPDGRPDEVVRGVDLIGTPLQAFERILAAGDDPAVFNGSCGAESGFVPVSAISPSLLLSQIEVERKRSDHDRPPLLPPPRYPDLRWSVPPPTKMKAPIGRGT